MNKDYKRLLQNFISLVIVQGGGYIVPLITLPYLVHVLGIENYGKIAYALVFNQYFIVLAAFGFDLSAPRAIAENINNPKKINEIFSSVLLIRGVFAVLLVPVLMVLVEVVPSLSDIRAIVFLTYGFVIAQALAPNWFFQGIERMKFITITNLGSRILYALLVFVLVRSEEDILLAPALFSGGFLLSAFVAVFLCFRIYKLSFYIPPIRVLAGYLSDSFSFFLSRISVSLYTLSNTFVIGTFGTMEMTGIYAVAEKLYQAMQGIYHPLMNSLYPFITRLKDVAMFIRIFLTACLVNVLIVAVAYFVADWVFLLLFPDAAQESVEVFRWLIMVTLVIVPSILLGYPFLAAMGHPKFTNVSVIISSFVHILNLSVLVLLGKVSLYNIVVIIFITEFIVMGIRLFGTFKYDLWRQVKNQKNYAKE